MASSSQQHPKFSSETSLSTNTASTDELRWRYCISRVQCGLFQETVTIWGRRCEEEEEEEAQPGREEQQGKMMVALALTKKLHLVQVNREAYFCFDSVLNVLAPRHLFHACGELCVCVTLFRWRKKKGMHANHAYVHA